VTWPGPGPWPPAATAVIAHRGGRTPGVAENSLAAFEAAVAAGADLIEFDVRRTADGALVVNHDPRVDGVVVARAPLARLRELALPPALVAEVVDRFAGRIGMDVELKEAGYEPEVLAALAPALRAPAPVFLSSFSDAAVAAARRLAPGVGAGLLLRDARRVERRLAACDATLALPWRGLDRTAFRARIARAGLPQAAWTVDDPRALAARLRDPRVAGVITNLPERALALRARED